MSQPPFYQGQLASASNRADWIVEFQATDANGDPYDWSSISAAVVTVADTSGCELLTGSLANGKITIPAEGSIKWQFTPEEMATVLPGTHNVGFSYKVEGIVTPLFIGTVVILEGVAKIS